LHHIYGYSRETLWQQVSTVLQGLLEHYRSEINPLIYKWFYQQLLFMPWRQKSLLAMRLNQDQDEPVFFALDNPLSQFND
jgi:hypothetical protein